MKSPFLLSLLSKNASVINLLVWLLVLIPFDLEVVFVLDSMLLLIREYIYSRLIASLVYGEEFEIIDPLFFNSGSNTPFSIIELF